MVEAQEEESERETADLHAADDRRFLRAVATVGSAGARRDRERGRGTGAEVPGRKRQPGECGPAAPGNDITASVWPAKLWRRSTMNQPATPAIRATIVPASSAWTMNG